MILKAAALALPILLASCSEPQCQHQRAFDHWLFQQTWFISETPGTEKYWKHREEWSIVELDKNTLTLQFQDGATYKYYRAGR